MKLILLAIIIGSNNLAVSMVLGALGQEKRKGRILLIFGLFEFFVPLAGIIIGSTTARWLQDEATWLSVLLLMLLGIWTIIAGLYDQADYQKLTQKITTWKGLILLSAGLSVDNMVIGFTLGLDYSNPLVIASTICLTSVVFSYAGLKFGDITHKHYECAAQIAAGSLLLIMAFLQWKGFL